MQPTRSIGPVQRLVVDPADRHVTDVLLEAVDDGVLLNLTRTK
jgi:hypothetical protein